MIAKEEIEDLAALTRLKLNPEDVGGLQKDISTILEYVGQVSVVGIKSAEALKPLLRNVMREDTPEGFMLAGKREALLKALPRREGDYAVVRKIIQKDE